MKTILGLDLGTNSIGWALINQDFENKTGKILGMGSRIIPMGTDKQDYEKGIGISKNAERRSKRTIRKMNKRYKLRRNKLLYILHELGMLPEQFKFKNGLPESNKIQNLELLPIKKGTFQLDSLKHYQLRENALTVSVTLEEFGKILYSYNQLRGYAGGNNDDESAVKIDLQNDEEIDSIKKYEVFTQKVLIKDVSQSDVKFKGRGKNKDLEFNRFNVTILIDDEELEGETELQNLFEKLNQEEELEIRIRRNKKGEKTSVFFALPQKTNWRKQMEKTEEDLKEGNLFISQLIIRDLKRNKWTKVRNRVFLRNRYQLEFDAIWEAQSRFHSILNNCPKEKIEKIVSYIFPGKSQTQEKLRQEGIEKGLKYIIKEQIIYFQRPLKSQSDLINKCQFEKNEQVLANSHPIFQEFRCWKQINNLYITSKKEVFNEKKKKNVFQYSNRFLSNIQKQELFNKLQTQKQLGFAEVAKIVNLKGDNSEYLNGLNTKSKLIGCETQITIKKILGGYFDILYNNDNSIVLKIWKAIFDNVYNGSEYDPNSPKVSSIKKHLNLLNNDSLESELALTFAKNVKFPRKYSSLSEKAILHILPLMQLNTKNVSEKIKNKFEIIKNNILQISKNEIVDIETGEIISGLEDYVVDFVKNNPNILENGGIMETFAISLAYGKHTTEKISPQFKNYHEIKRIERNLRNPIVEQLANETMQVIKALWKQYNFDPNELEIRVELARDLKNSAKERDRIFKAQIKNQKTNEAIKLKLEEENIQVTDENILKYKLYQEQKFISPYSGETMRLSLFDNYEIDHIIPKSRYFDDSYSNKVLVEGKLNNEKSNRTAWEYISQQNSRFKIFQSEKYVNHINDTFFGKKKNNLLLEKIPSNPVERQLKDTQYISVAVKNELAKIVGSDNVKTSTGEVTSFLRSRWGLKKLFMELTEERFKQMELWDWNKETNQTNTQWINKYFDKKKEKNIYQIKNWSKRFDHRHHAIDALVVALTDQSYIQRLNNLNKFLQDELTNRNNEFKIELNENETILEAYFNLDEKRRLDIQNQIVKSSRDFEMPFNDLIIQSKNHLESMIVSIKPKDKIGITFDRFDKNTPNKKLKPQVKIKGALHQETNYGKSKDLKTGLMRDTKTIELSNLMAKDIPQIIDVVLKSEIGSHQKKYDSFKEAFSGEGLKAFNENRFQKNKPDVLKPPVYKIKVWYSNKETEASTLQRLYSENNRLSVLTGDNYLFLVMEKSGNRIFDIASLFDSVDIAKRTISENRENYLNQIYEDFKVKHKDKPDKVLFSLKQNDLVYLPENEDDPVLKLSKKEFIDWVGNIENKKAFSKRIFRVVKFTGKDCFFIPVNYASTISVPKDLNEEQKKSLKKQYEGKKIPKQELNYQEFGSFGTSAKTEVNEDFVKELILKKDFYGTKPIKIQEKCIKIDIDWLGNITKD
jgi:CRISPR subtype II RNA-guided endonuclease Cas9/Csn1